MINSDDILQKLQTKKERLDSFRPLQNELIKNLEDWFRIELTYTSNAIEGNTLTRQETALVVEEGLTVQGKSLTEHQEAINHAEAVEPERVDVPKPSTEQRFYTTEEVSKLLQVDPETVRRYVRQGDLKAVKLGGKFIRIDKTDLDKFIENLKK